MSVKRKNMIVGEGGNLFAGSPLRFLIYSMSNTSFVGHAELVSASLNKNGCPGHSEILEQVQDDGRKSFRTVIVLFLLCSSISFASNFTPADSLKNKYDVNDPRNPHCPCHQYQKMADEEYARSQRKERNVNVVNGEQKNPDLSLRRQHGPLDLFRYCHKKRKFMGKNKNGKGYRIMKNKISDKLSRCFHF